jgi:hypothetical protein
MRTSVKIVCQWHHAGRFRTARPALVDNRKTKMAAYCRETGTIFSQLDRTARFPAVAALNQARAIWQQGNRQAAQAAAGIAADVLASIGSSEAAAAKAFEEALANAADGSLRRTRRTRPEG